MDTPGTSRAKSLSRGACFVRAKANTSLTAGRPGCAISRISLWAPGLGPESYAIIEQGRIGQILSNKPQDRRAIIEEAAGIGKFKTQEAVGGSQAGRRETEPVARVRHFGRGWAAGEFAEAASFQSEALRRAKDRDDRPSARVADGAVPDAGARCSQDGTGFESRERRVPEPFHTSYRKRAGT